MVSGIYEINDGVLDLRYHQEPLTVSTEGLRPKRYYPQANPTEPFRLFFQLSCVNNCDDLYVLKLSPAVQIYQ